MPGPSAVVDQTDKSTPPSEGDKTQNVRQLTNANPPSLSNKIKTEVKLDERKLEIEKAISDNKIKRNKAITLALEGLALLAFDFVKSFVSHCPWGFQLSKNILDFSMEHVNTAVQHHREVKKLQEQEAQIQKDLRENFQEGIELENIPGNGV